MDKSTEQAFDKIERVADMAMIERNAAIARAERAEAAANDCRRVVAAIPWRSLASIYAHPGVVLDADADAIGEFLDQYADAWAGGFAPSEYNNDLLSPGENDERHN